MEFKIVHIFNTILVLKCTLLNWSWVKSNSNWHECFTLMYQSFRHHIAIWSRISCLGWWLCISRFEWCWTSNTKACPEGYMQIYSSLIDGSILKPRSVLLFLPFPELSGNRLFSLLVAASKIRLEQMGFSFQQFVTHGLKGLLIVTDCELNFGMLLKLVCWFLLQETNNTAMMKVMKAQRYKCLYQISIICRCFAHD